MRDAADVGSEIHARMEHWAHNVMDGTDLDLPPLDNEIAFKSSQACIEWLEDRGAVPIGIETVLFSSSLRVCGGTDLICTQIRPGSDTSDDRVEIVWDYKTAKQIYREHKIQVTAYRDMAIELQIVGPDALAGVLLIDKTGKKRKPVKPWVSNELYRPDDSGLLTVAWQSAIQMGNAVKALDVAKIW